MKRISTAPVKRTMASMMLLVWLLALGSGVVNACVLEARDAPPQAASDASYRAHQPAPDGHGAHAIDPAHDAGDPKAPCLKACSDGAHSLPAQSSALDLSDPGTPYLVAVLWILSAAGPSMPAHLRAGQPPPPDQPVRTRFSRLAL